MYCFVWILLLSYYFSHYSLCYDNLALSNCLEIVMSEFTPCSYFYHMFSSCTCSIISCSVLVRVCTLVCHSRTCMKNYMYCRYSIFCSNKLKTLSIYDLGNKKNYCARCPICRVLSDPVGSPVLSLPSRLTSNQLTTSAHRLALLPNDRRRPHVPVYSSNCI